MEYLNNDIAPDLIRFMKVKMGNMNRSYYSFLKKIGEEGLPLFNDSQIEFIDNVSELLPLVRDDEYLIINQILNDKLDINKLIGFNFKVTEEILKHALYILNKKNILLDNKLNVDLINDQFIKYMNDLLEYGLTRCDIEFGEYDTKFKLMRNYYKEQIQFIRLKDGLMSVKGTEFENDEAYCMVGLNKNTKIDERLRYKDKFIDSKIFQWESETNTTLTNSTGRKILNTKVVHLFIRKIKEEDGITLPFTYIGTGKFTNIRESYTEENGKRIPTLLTDIILDNEVPSEYWLDFEIKDSEVI